MSLVIQKCSEWVVNPGAVKEILRGSKVNIPIGLSKVGLNGIDTPTGTKGDLSKIIIGSGVGPRDPKVVFVTLGEPINLVITVDFFGLSFWF